MRILILFVIMLTLYIKTISINVVIRATKSRYYNNVKIYKKGIKKIMEHNEKYLY